MIMQKSQGESSTPQRAGPVVVKERWQQINKNGQHPHSTVALKHFIAHQPKVRGTEALSQQAHTWPRSGPGGRYPGTPGIHLPSNEM